jgi:hypothetical protein
MLDKRPGLPRGVFSSLFDGKRQILVTNQEFIIAFGTRATASLSPGNLGAMVHNRIYRVLPEISLGSLFIIFGRVHELNIKRGKFMQAELDDLAIGGM